MGCILASKLNNFSFLLLVIPVFVLSDSMAVTRPEPLSRSSSGSVSPSSPKAVPRNQFQKTTSQKAPARTRDGYCYVADKIEKSSESVCKRKRGVFYTDQRAALKAYDSKSGYCFMKDGGQRSSRAQCKRVRGEFFVKHSDANRKCADTRGYCVGEGSVTADTRGGCGRKKAKFFLSKKEAEAHSARQKGHCYKKGVVSPLTKGACTKKSGEFYVNKKDAEKKAARTNGYCCVAGKVIRTNQGSCKQKKGEFHLRQILAGQACKKERGFCCIGGNVVSLTREGCEQKEGKFSSNRLKTMKTCVPNDQHLSGRGRGAVQGQKVTIAQSKGSTSYRVLQAERKQSGYPLKAAVKLEKSSKLNSTVVGKKGFFSEDGISSCEQIDTGGAEKAQPLPSAKNCQSVRRGSWVHKGH